jgi:hypothetical protein
MFHKPQIFCWLLSDQDPVKMDRTGYLQLRGYLHSIVELLSDGGDVHGRLDDLLVGGELLGVDRVEEGPGLLMTPQLRQQGVAD